MKEFDLLVNVGMPSPNDQAAAMRHMKPLESLGTKSNHTAWMPEYTVDGLRIASPRLTSTRLASTRGGCLRMGCLRIWMSDLG